VFYADCNRQRIESVKGALTRAGYDVVSFSDVAAQVSPRQVRPDILIVSAELSSLKDLACAFWPSARVIMLDGTNERNILHLVQSSDAPPSVAAARA
jgi:hypothetical protein